MLVYSVPNRCLLMNQSHYVENDVMKFAKNIKNLESE